MLYTLPRASGTAGYIDACVAAAWLLVPADYMSTLGDEKTTALPNLVFPKRFQYQLPRACYSEDTVAAQDYLLQLPMARLLTVL